MKLFGNLAEGIELLSSTFTFPVNIEILHEIYL
jgi:hypothetical protein